MEALVEIIFDLIFEVFGEFIFVLIGKLFNKAESDSKTLKIVKISVYSVIALLLMALLITSIIYKKGLIILFVLSYLGLLLVAYYLIFLFREVMVNPNGEKIIRWIVRIIRYPFTISLIVLASLYLNDEIAKALMITGSVIGLIIFILIDAFRIYRYNNKIKIEEDIED